MLLMHGIKIFENECNLCKKAIIIWTLMGHILCDSIRYLIYDSFMATYYDFSYVV